MKIISQEEKQIEIFKTKKLFVGFVFLVVFFLGFFGFLNGVHAATTDFITTWKTDNPGTSNFNQITIPTYSGETYDYTVDWGDGNTESIATDASPTHTYVSAGTYTVKISGIFPRIYFNDMWSDLSDSRKILSVEQWGINAWSSMGSAFKGASNLVINATDTPNFSNATDMSYMFTDATSFNQNINNWDVLHITDMNHMFYGASSYNQPLNNWNVSNVTNMNGMFFNNFIFNQPLNSWNVSNVTDMGGMFFNETNFNQDISSWHVSNVISMQGMFSGATSFNQPLNNWDVSNVTNMAGMFSNTYYNLPLNSWIVSSVTNMSQMFQQSHFNQNINNWDVSNVTNMSAMFSISVFNQPLNSWNVSKVTNMGSMFSNMFNGPVYFDQDISSWNVLNVTDMSYMFNKAYLSTANYDALLNSWSALTLQPGVSFDAGSSKYTSLSSAARNILTSAPNNWGINDGGQLVDITSFDPIGDALAGVVGRSEYLNSSEAVGLLPSNVCADSCATAVPVISWTDTDGYNPAIVGSYTFTAVLGAIPTGFSNPSNLTATVEVVIYPVSPIYWWSNGIVGDDWSTQTDWWTDINHTTQALNLPTEYEDAIILGTSGTGPSVDLDVWSNSPAFVNSSTTGISFTSTYGSGISFNIIGNATFNNTVSNGTITGNPIFNNSDNYGSIIGNPIFNNNNSYNYNGTITGNPTFNNYSYNNGGTITGNATFNDTSYSSNGLINGNPIFNDSSFNMVAIITGNPIFNDNSRNDNGTIIGNPIFNDNSYNSGDITGSPTFNNSSYTYGSITGNATFSGDLSENNGNGSISGTKTRRYSTPISTNRNFVSTGPWTVIADGAEVNIFHATKDTNISSSTYTTFQTLNGGSFVDTMQPTIYYWNDGIESNSWTNQNNWWTDEAHTIQATNLPTGSDDVKTLGTVAPSVDLDDPLWVSPANIDVTATGVNITSVNGSWLHGNIIGDSTFTNNIYNNATITGDVTFSGLGNYGSITGNVLFNNNAFNGAEIIGNVVFNNSSYNSGAIIGNPTFNNNSYNNYGTIIGDPIFNNNSYIYGTITGNPIFNDNTWSRSSTTITGNPIFNNSSSNSGTITGNPTFNGDLSENNGSISGTKTRRYSTPISTNRNFVSTGPWTVIADGVEVNIFYATKDTNISSSTYTTFQTLNGGSFSDTMIPTIYYWNDGIVDPSWITQENWWTDVTHLSQATNLPTSSDDVKTLGTIAPNVDLDDSLWVQPTNIDVTITGINITSANGNGINSNIIGSPVFNNNSYDSSGTITGNPTFNDNSYDVYGNITGNPMFNDSSYNNGTITGNPTFNNSSYNNGDITGNATFSGDLSENNGSISGTKTRHYTTPISINRNFVSTGPWTVIADGAEVNIFHATKDTNISSSTYTTFQTLNGGSFVDTMQPTIYYWNDGVESNSWTNQNNWWTDEVHLSQATNLPTVNDDVKTLGTVTPNVNLDDPLWISPANIDATITGINITSVNGNGISSSIIGSPIFNDNSFNNYGAITGSPIFNDNSYNYGTIIGNPIFNNNSYNNGTITGNPVFNSSTYNSGTINGNSIFKNSSINYSSITGNATFEGNSSSDYGSVSGTRTRRFISDTIISLNFVSSGYPWTILADGAVVNIFYANYDTNPSSPTYTTLSTMNGGSFVITAPTFVKSDFYSTPDNPGINKWNLNGPVYSSVVASDGTIYIGGSFSSAGGESHSNIASFNSDGTLNNKFKANINGVVYAFALSKDGSTLYAGGLFTNADDGVDSLTRNNLASFSTITGLLTTFDPNLSASNGDGGRVAQLIVSNDGNTLYASGGFSNVGVTTHSHLASWNISDPSNITLNAFNPGSINGGVSAISLSNDGSTLYLGGAFNKVNNVTRNFLASVSTFDGSLTSFDPNLDGQVNSLILSPDRNTLYVQGNFSSINGGVDSRNYFASFDTVTGLLNNFDPKINGYTSPAERLMILTPDGNTLFIGGRASVVMDSISRSHLSSWRASDGKLTNFDPNLNIHGQTLTFSFSPDGSKLYVGGSFSSVGGDYNQQYFTSFSIIPPTNLTVYNSILSSVVESHYTPESWATYMVVVNANLMTMENTQEEVDNAVINIIDAQSSLVRVTVITDWDTSGTGTITTKEDFESGLLDTLDSTTSSGDISLLPPSTPGTYNDTIDTSNLSFENKMVNGSFYNPYGLAADSTGNIYVADYGNNRIQKFDSSGVYLSQFGTSGSGDGELSGPVSVYVDATGNIYVADINNNRIQKFNSSGVYLFQFGTPGSGDGELSTPFSLQVDPIGNIYVADYNNNRIQKFDSSGIYQSQFGIQGSADGEFNYPMGVYVDATGNIYVADTSNNRIQKFDSSGVYLSQFGTSGSGDGELSGPGSVYVDATGNVYAVDSGNNRIEKFDSSGVYLSQFGTYGSGDGEFNYPMGVYVDATGNIYVADTNNNRIQKFDSNGIFISKFGFSNTIQGNISKFIDVNSALLSWQTKASMADGRVAPASGVIDGKIYIAGGSGLSSLTIYNPADDTYDDSKPAMSTGLTNPMSAVLDNKLYVIGGRDSSTDLGVSSVEMYDPAVGVEAWTSKTPMSRARTGATGGAYDGKIYVVGGATGPCSGFETSGEVFDPSGNSGSGSWSSIASAPVAKMTSATAQFINGIMYVAGGQTDCSSPYSNSLVSYDPVANTWNTNLANMPFQRAGGSSVAIDGKFYYIGGTEDSRNKAKDIYRYDPVINSWITYTGAFSRGIHRSSTQMVGDYLYVIGGMDNNDTLKTTYRLNKIRFNKTNIKKINQITWTATTPADTSVEMLYSLDFGTTFTSLGTVAGTYSLSSDTADTITYKALLTNLGSGDNPSLDSLSLSYATVGQPLGVFTSAVLNNGNNVDWTTFTADSTLPTGTNIVYATRSGDAPIPDGTWSEWQETTGDILSPNSIYIQVMATFTTENDTVPVLHSITINYLMLDNTPLTVLLSSTSTNQVSGSFDVTATFSKDVTGFTADDITIANGTITNFTGSGTTYTFTVTPTSEGNINMIIASGVAVDINSNSNTTSAQFSRIYTVARSHSSGGNVVRPPTPTIIPKIDIPAPVVSPVKPIVKPELPATNKPIVIEKDTPKIPVVPIVTKVEPTDVVVENNTNNNNPKPNIDNNQTNTNTKNTDNTNGTNNINNGNASLGKVIVESVKDSFNKTVDITKKTIKEIAKIIETPAGSITSKIITTSGVIAGASVSIASILFINPLSFSELFMIPLRLWSLLLAALGIKKKNKPWGTVYDSVTKQPIDPAYVILQDLNGNEVATSITDLDGRYGFLVAPGQYRLIAKKTNYNFPSNKLDGKDNDELYQDLYTSGIITVGEDGIISKNIPMDPINFDWNEFAKKQEGIMKFFNTRDIWINHISNILFIVGIIIALIAAIVSPAFYNISILVVYIVVFVLKRTILKPRALGYIKQQSNGLPLSFAVLRLFYSGSDNEVIHKVADITGKYYCLVPNGVYYAKIENKNPDQSYSLVKTTEPITITDGYLSQKFEV